MHYRLRIGSQYPTADSLNASLAVITVLLFGGAAVLLTLFVVAGKIRRPKVPPTTKRQPSSSLQHAIRQELRQKFPRLPYTFPERYDFLCRAAYVRCLSGHPSSSSRRPPVALLQESVEESEFYAGLLQWAVDGCDLMLLQDCWIAMQWAVSNTSTGMDESRESISDRLMIPDRVLHEMFVVILRTPLIDQMKWLELEPTLLEQTLKSQSRRVQSCLELLGAMQECKDVQTGITWRMLRQLPPRMTTTTTSISWREEFAARLLTRAISNDDGDEDSMVRFAVLTIPSYMLGMRQYDRVARLLSNEIFLDARIRMLGAEESVYRHVADLKSLIHSVDQGLVDIPKESVENACAALAGTLLSWNASPDITGKLLFCVATFLMHYKGTCKLSWGLLDKARYFQEVALHESNVQFSKALHSTGVLYHVRQEDTVSEKYFDLASRLHTNLSVGVIQKIYELTEAGRSAAAWDRPLGLYQDQLLTCMRTSLVAHQDLTRTEAEMGLPLDEERDEMVALYSRAATSSNIACTTYRLVDADAEKTCLANEDPSPRVACVLIA